MKEKKENKKGTYWYKRVTKECPVCGRGDTFKIRVYGPKPEDNHQRYEYNPRYDYCNSL